MIDRREQPQRLHLWIVQGLLQRIHGRKARVDVDQKGRPGSACSRRKDGGQLHLQALALDPITRRERRQLQSADALQEIQQEFRLQRAQRDVAAICRRIHAVLR